MTVFDHPLLDFVEGEYACTEARGHTVYFSEPFADFLTSVRAAGLTPVVIARHDAWWTFAARYYLDLFGGWALVRTGDLFVDPVGAKTGETVSELLEARVHAVLPSQREPELLQAVVSVSVHHAATEQTVLGRLVDVVSGELGQAMPAAWGAHEPATLAWDTATLTAHSRAQMPEVRTFITGGGGALQGIHRVERTGGGVLETFTAVTPIAALDAPTEMVAERATHALTVIAEAFSMPLFGSVTVIPGWRDGRVPAFGTQPIAVPVAMLIGPRAVRALGVDLTVLAARFDVSLAGRQRIPSLVAGFSDPDVPPWRQADELARAFGTDAIARAVAASGGV
ncbi:hypothetical protein QFZ53_002825 [Microbacterium natoriense]|uniref:Uncharacterized protein n=1 Tax=Microbacterium natoriense TaxID=284570 RepID=A0AAW8F171_9MICO|nr:DUF6177 family protein [Microbacterium natoriense]MDQ0648629.1 hypothetical protein [Microbacterium natoriense]